MAEVRCYVEINASQWGIFMQRMESRADVDYEKRHLGMGRLRVTMRSEQFPAAWQDRTMEIVEDKGHASGIGFKLGGR